MAQHCLDSDTAWRAFVWIYSDAAWRAFPSTTTTGRCPLTGTVSHHGVLAVSNFLSVQTKKHLLSPKNNSCQSKKTKKILSVKNKTKRILSVKNKKQNFLSVQKTKNILSVTTTKKKKRRLPVSHCLWLTESCLLLFSSVFDWQDFLSHQSKHAVEHFHCEC